MTAFRKAAPALAGVALAFAATPSFASTFKEFRDWWAACDNLRNCSAYGFDAVLTGGSYIRIERGGAPAANPKIMVSVDAGEGVTFKLAFDDPALPGLPSDALRGEDGEATDLRRISFTGGSADTLITSLRKAKEIVVTRIDPPGRKSDTPVTRISLSGAAAALLWIDEQQKRLDTTTAFIRRGNKPASSIPPQPRPTVVVAAKGLSGDAAEKKPSPREEAVVKEKGRQLCGEGDEGEFENADALSADSWLYSFKCPGSSGAYNFGYTFLIARAGQPQAARQPVLRWPVKIGDLQTDSDSERFATNPQFSNADMTLTTFSKGRGIGDCGTEEIWVFDGKGFRLLEVKMMPHCRGVPLDDWPVLYRAERK